jgi:Spy/CpxP family protein refolding chaperone
MRTWLFIVVTLVALQTGARAQAPKKATEQKANAPAAQTAAQQAGLFGDLNLTQQQKDKLAADRKQNQEKLRQLREQLRTRRQELNSELNKTPLDKKKIARLAADITRITGQVLDVRIQSAIALKETLTKEQFARFQAKLKQLTEQAQKNRNPLQRKQQGAGEAEDFEIGEGKN